MHALKRAADYFAIKKNFIPSKKINFNKNRQDNFSSVIKNIHVTLEKFSLICKI